MDEVASFIPKPSELTLAQKKLYAEVVKADRTGKSLMEQGYDRSDIQYSMRLLVGSGFVFKYGIGVNTFYSIHKYEDGFKPKRLNPIVLPEGLKNNHTLAFRMGYTDTKPHKGKVHKGILNEH